MPAEGEHTLTDDIARIIYITLALVLVGSGLAWRQLPAGHMLRLVLIWVAIFAVAWMVVRFATGMS